MRSAFSIPEAMREELESFLQQRSLERLFLFSNLDRGGLENRGELFQGIWLGCQQAGQLRGVVQCVNQGSLLVALDDPASTDVARSLARLVIDSGFQPLRILGMEQEVGSLLRELQTLASFPVREQRNSLLQVLTRETLSKTGEARPGLQMRLARPDDLSLLLDWKCRFRIDALGDDPSWLNLEVMKASLELSLREQHQYVLEAEGRLVSMARLNARTTHHAQLGGVYTPREERGRGYASWLTAALCRDCLDGGVDAVTLMVEAEKRTANLIYERIGFQTRGIYTFLLLIPLGKDLG